MCNDTKMIAGHRYVKGQNYDPMHNIEHERIKKYASKLAKELNIKLHKALNLVALDLGFPSWNSLKRKK